MNKEVIENHLLNYFTIDKFDELCNMEDLYQKAYIIVNEVFKNKTDKAGKPYVEHLYRVSDKLDEEIEKVAGLLHDTFEDTDITYNDLLNVGFSKEILDVVRIVTNEKNNKSNMGRDEKLRIYSQKIDSIINSKNIHAIKLKEADMSDNYNQKRLSKLSKEKQEWFHDKYKNELDKLRKVIYGDLL